MSSQRPVLPRDFKNGDSYAKLDCGCQLGKQSGVFLIKPCSPRCPIYVYVMEQSLRQGKPIWYIPVKE